MALSINTNLYALNAQRNLRKSESPLAQAMQRLSSTLRINSAKDDAAGLAIATRMTTQVNGLAVAMRNANNGVSFSQTAEGAMDEMINSLQRIYELANQSASYNTSADRSSMNQEVRQLVSELNRIVAQTRYNGEKFLNQAFSISLQVGTEVNEIISLSTQKVSPDSFGVQSTRADFDDTSTNRNAIASAVAGMTLRALSGLENAAALAGVDLGAAISYTDTANNSQVIINRINEYTSSHGVTAFSFGNTYVATNAMVSSGGVANAGYLTINGVSIGSTTTFASSAGGTAAGLVSAINDKTTSTGVYAVLLGSADTGTAGKYSISLVNTSGAAITVSVATANAGTASALAAYFGTSGGSISAGQNGQVTFSTPLGTSSRTTEGASTTLALGFGSAAATISISNRQSANDVTVTTAGNANLAILSVKQSLDTINTEKSKLGATLNRLESTLKNLDNVRENITAARSRIMDANFAEETANLTRAMIMQQAGISVLAQANTLPQQILALLGGR